MSTACPHCGGPLPEPGAVCPSCGEQSVLTIEQTAAGDDGRTDAEERTGTEAFAPETDAGEDLPTEEIPTEDDPGKESSGEEDLPKEGDASEDPPEEELPGEDVPAEDPPAEESPAEEEAPSGETISAEQSGEETPAAPAEGERRRARLRLPAFVTDPEARGKLLRTLGVAFTALGLLALLGVALALIQMNRQNRDARESRERSENVPLPGRPAVINFYTPVREGQLRSEGDVRFSGDELIAVASEGRSYTDMERFFGERNIRVIGYVELMDVYQLCLPEPLSLAGLTAAAEKLEREEEVDCAAVSAVWDTVAYLAPEDPWDEESDWEELSPRGGNWGVQAIRAPECWEDWSSNAVRVGLIDGAFDPRQEDLRYALLRRNLSGPARSTGEESMREHGTAVASVIGAVHDNGLGLSGVVKDCRIYAYGSGALSGQMDALSALAELAVQGVSVVQYSLGWPEELALAIGESDSPAARYYRREPARLAAMGLERMLDKGYDFLLVLPAGNGSEEEEADASCASVFSAVEAERVRSRILVVGAVGVDRKGNYYEAPFSARGPRVDLLGPGVDLYAALPDGDYARKSGTSLAAAYVTGLCASAWTLNPALSGAELRDLAIESAQDLVPDGSAGLADMAAALEAASLLAPERPLPDQGESALDAYGALLRKGVQLKLRGAFGIRSVPATHYWLMDVDMDGVEELLVYAMDPDEFSASFALYGYRSGELVCLADAWNSCRFSSWSNMELTLEVWDGSYLFAGAEKNSAGYGETGESFTIGCFGRSMRCFSQDLRPDQGERIALIENSALTEEGIRIGSARDLLRDR